MVTEDRLALVRERVTYRRAGKWTSLLTEDADLLFAHIDEQDTHIRTVETQGAADRAVVAAVDVACPEFWHNAADILRHDGDWPEAANHLDEMADALAAREKATE